MCSESRSMQVQFFGNVRIVKVTVLILKHDNTIFLRGLDYSALLLNEPVSPLLLWGHGVYSYVGSTLNPYYNTFIWLQE